MLDNVYAIKTETIIQFICKLCDYECGEKKDKTNHMEIEHAEGMFLCDNCEYQAETKYGLSKHIENQHTLDQNFSEEYF